jgi:biotin operon repressor
MRTERLLKLLQMLRRHRHPISAQALADELAVSIRTVYRDIATLQVLGAEVEGEPGLGYVLAPSYFLPPLMLSDIEIEALTLGMRWVSTFADAPLAKGASDALAKIEAVLPSDLREGIGAMPLRVGQPPSRKTMDEDLTCLREAIRNERKIKILYRDRRRHRARKDHLAVRNRLLRGWKGAGGVVRIARRLPAFPHEQHNAGKRPGRTQSAWTIRDVSTVARVRNGRTTSTTPNRRPSSGNTAILLNDEDWGGSGRRPDR